MQLLKDFLHLFVDEGCRTCGQSLSAQEQLVCFNCLGQIQQTDFHLRPTENELYYRLAGRVELWGATGLFYFDKKGILQQLVNAFKYKDSPDMAVQMGRILGSALHKSEFIAGLEAIVPVPLHPAKARKRGYNQAECIAQGISEIIDIPVDCDCLKRRRNTRTQTRKSREARWKNVSGAFSVSDRPPANILLVDDVVTTGATLEACIEALSQISASPTSVRIACIGVARH
ncbi:MAG: ComF family protein [Bacteroidia bacterium]